MAQDETALALMGADPVHVKQLAFGIAVGTCALAGALLIILTQLPLALLNVVAGIVYAIALPYMALTTSYVYLDARVRDELATEPALEELPAEVSLAR